MGSGYYNREHVDGEFFISEVAEIVALNLGEEIVDVALENDYLFLAVVLEFLCYIRFRNSF